MTGMHYHTKLFPLKWNVLLFFLHWGWLQTMILPTSASLYSYDYGCEPPALSLNWALKIRERWKRINMTNILSIHVWKLNNETCWNCSKGKLGRIMKEWI
jgi:hypothetical protein